MFRFSRRAVIFLLTFSLVITSFLSHGLMQADAVTGTSIVYGKDAIAKALKKGDKIYFGQVASGYTGLNLWRVGNPSGSNTGDGSRITVNFSDATTGNSNDYVSAIIEKNGKASYYGKFAQNKANGTISFPSNLMGQGSELYIFSERCNGDYKTDYASSFVKVAVPEYIPPKTDIKKTTAAVNAPSLAVNVKAYKPKAAKKAVTVKWKKATKNIRRKISGYQVQIASSPDFSNAKTYKASKKASSKRIKKLSKRTKYYVRVRAYKGAACGAWSKVKTVKTK